jgi:hypothetical protein
VESRWSPLECLNCGHVRCDLRQSVYSTRPVDWCRFAPETPIYERARMNQRRNTCLERLQNGAQPVLSGLF